MDQSAIAIEPGFSIEPGRFGKLLHTFPAHIPRESDRTYFTAEKRLSKEFDCTIG
jgi:hypothetical protein